MKHCNKCRVTVRGNETVCPLCQNKLSGTAQDSIYPEVPTIYKQYNFLFKALILSTIAGCAACVAINLILPHTGFWSIFVLLGSLCFWITLAYAVKSRDNIAKDITVWVLIISVLSVVWDWSIGWQGWSLNFAFPIVCSIAMVSLAVIAKVMKMQGEDYIIYLIVDILFGVVPFILYITGFISIIIPSFICIVLSIVSISSLILFEGRNILDEFRKHFHV
ncbi:MAG: DUF6320 domain-containing protein [Eubacteriales bacterium]